MAEFLRTAGLNFYIERMLDQAEREIVIISPYIKLQPKTRSRLREKKKQGLRIDFACRKRDLKESLSDCSTQVHDVPTLHAKCYLSEKLAIIASLNLHEFSQVNNDEMGFCVESSGTDALLYAEVLAEARRLCPHPEPESTCPGVAAPTPHVSPAPSGEAALVEDKAYSHDELDARFGFKFKGAAGIKEAHSGELVLFNNSEKRNPEINGIVYYCGQETGGPEQALRFGNEVLNDCWSDKKRVIHMFKKGAYAGQFKIVEEPYPDVEGKYRFPLKKVPHASA